MPAETENSEWLTADERLARIAIDLESGKPSPTVSVREFLGWFNAQRRGSWIVWRIKSYLEDSGLVTVPNFEHTWIDARISFQLAEASSAESCDGVVTTDDAIALPETDADDGKGPIWVSREATYRISRLRAANQNVVFASPDDTLASVITKMMTGGYSQLPLMQNERDVKGMVSWQTIGTRLALRAGGTTARHVSEPHHEIRADRSIFDAIPIILANDYVLVRDEKNSISGIITAADLSLQFRELTEPFLLLSEIENLLRNLIGDRFSPEELKEACDSRDDGRGAITTVADLSLGEYIRLIQKPDRWDKLGLAVDRVMFCDKLDQVRIIRNDVMHFDPDGIGESELAQLREFTRFLQQLMTVLGGTL